jgi:hypothetical protein
MATDLLKIQSKEEFLILDVTLLTKDMYMDMRPGIYTRIITIDNKVSWIAPNGSVIRGSKYLREQYESL